MAELNCGADRRSVLRSDAVAAVRSISRAHSSDCSSLRAIARMGNIFVGCRTDREADGGELVLRRRGGRTECRSHDIRAVLLGI